MARKHFKSPAVRVRRLLPVIAFLPLLFAGCGGGSVQKDTAPVTGKVTYNGEPVKGGTLIFSPVPASEKAEPGKAGMAEIQPDGTFTVSTYSQGDGAVVGKNDLSYTPPPPEAAEAPEGGHTQEVPKSPYDGLVPESSSVEVKPEANTFEIKLVPGGS